MKISNSASWQRLVSRIAGDSFFLGSSLNAFRAAHGFDPVQLAQWLCCSPSSLDRLALCRLPDDQELRFQDEVRRIAAFVPCDADRLVDLLREVVALQSFRETGDAVPESLLMAARDRKKTEEDKA